MYTLFNVLKLGLILNSVLYVSCSAKILDNSRIHEHKLSDKEHYTDLDNDKKFDHNTDYDHEAFLGKEEAESFRQFTPEEAKERLGQLVDEIDTNKDGFVELEELNQWIKNVTHKNIMKEVERRWHTLENNNSLEAYVEFNYASLKLWTDEEKLAKKDDYKTYLKLMERDKKRFKAADQDGDGKLTKKEYADFLHPEESKHMNDIVINETLEDLDKNGDGVVNIDEFIYDIYPVTLNDSNEEPDWVKTERENFRLHRDKNKDNVMDREEVGGWILPSDFDHSLMEAQHLIYEADENKDGKLTKEEILEKYSIFVASTATSHGNAIYEKMEF